MAYIGRQNLGGAYRQLDDISSGFDGSDTTHTMQVNSANVTVGDVNQIILSLGGVIQKPGTDFTVSGSVLTFTTAPAANTSFFAVLLGSDNGGTVTPTDGSVTTSKFASGVAIGATGTANTLAGIPFFSDSSNSSMYTHDVSGTDDTAQYNTAFGFNALDAITTGDKHVAIGYNAGTAVTEAVGNVLIGEAAGAALTTGGSNILIGRLVGDAFDTEANNLAIGVAALGGSVAGGEYNVAVGNYTLDALTSGDNNTAVGYNALTADTAGNQSVAIGYGALAAQNFTSSTATENVAVGYNAGTSNTTGDYNTFIGGNAGTGVTTGAQKTLIGRYAGGNFDTENHNLAIGRNALGGSVAGGEYNVAIGNYTLDAVTSGDNNTCVGNSAGSALTTGSNNISIGHNSAFSSTNSSYAYVIGTNCESAGTGGYVTIGSDAGNNRIYNDFDVNATWQRVSDIRYKENIKPNTDCGLDFINDLNPVTFTWKAKADIDKSLPDYDETNLEPTHDKKMYGLIAQEVKAALDKHNITDFGGHNIIEKSGIQSIAQSMFIYPLIKAVQELSAQVTTLQNEVNTLKGE